MRNAILALAGIALVGCATTYHPMGSSSGYGETELAKGQYEVRFSANCDTDPRVASEFLLRRCAELSLESGSQWFEMICRDRHVVTRRVGKIRDCRQNSQAMIRVVSARTPDALDAVTIVEETNAAAKGRLSGAAQEALARLGVTPRPQPVKATTNGRP